jgi:hypothetical protein
MERREHAKSFFRLGALAMNGLFHPWNPEIRGSIPLVEALPRCEIRGPSSVNPCRGQSPKRRSAPGGCFGLFQTPPDRSLWEDHATQVSNDERLA